MTVAAGNPESSTWQVYVPRKDEYPPVTVLGSTVNVSVITLLEVVNTQTYTHTHTHTHTHTQHIHKQAHTRARTYMHIHCMYIKNIIIHCYYLTMAKCRNVVKITELVRM